MNLKKVLCIVTAMTVLLVSAIIPVQAEYINEVRVNNVDDLLASITSNTKIIVESGEYIIPAEAHDYDGYTYYVGKNISIEGLENLEIVADGYVEIALAVGDMPVVEIWQNSNNITLTGLTLGHDVPEYSCAGEGHVIAAYGADNITINDCDLYGCGIVGISCYNTGNVTVNNTIIRDCADAAAGFSWMNGNVEFNGCVFKNNAYDPYASQYRDCFTFEDNEEDSITPSVVFNDCVIEGNMNVGKMTVKDVDVQFNNCTERNNVWETTVKVGIVIPEWDGYVERMTFEDQKPVVIDGRTLIPVRGLFESYHFNYTVDWNGDTSTATLSNGVITVEITIGKQEIYKNGAAVALDVPAQIINGRTMIPLRAVAEAFDLNVEWDGETRSVLITKQ